MGLIMYILTTLEFPTHYFNFQIIWRPGQTYGPPILYRFLCPLNKPFNFEL